VNAFIAEASRNIRGRRDREIEEPSVIQPSLFAGLTGFVSLTNKEDQTTVTHALSVSGAKVVSTTHPDLIVTDLKDTFLATQAPGKRSPRIIQTKQIPWAMTPPWPKPFIVDCPLIVVSDATGRSRPSFAVVRNSPILHFDAVPKAYTASPFVAPPPDVENLMRNPDQCGRAKSEIELIDGPQDSGYCELCSCSFETGPTHRTSVEHRRRAVSTQPFAHTTEWKQFCLGACRAQ
jgi:hypothetical protein